MKVLLFVLVIDCLEIAAIVAVATCPEILATMNPLIHDTFDSDSCVDSTNCNDDEAVVLTNKVIICDYTSPLADADFSKIYWSNKVNL